MRKYFFILIILFYAVNSNAQDTIINSYASVLAYTAGGCNVQLTVDSTTGFGPGDDVFIIQMKGAAIDSTNTAAFGIISSWNNVGNYEFNKILSISGTIISLQYAVKKSYDIPYGNVQLVKVPHFKTYVINKQHTCRQWGGRKGGVFALITSDSLIFNSNINVSGNGFRGGITDSPNNNIIYKIHQLDYCYPDNAIDGAAKGEGIATVSANKIYCRGPLYNGGGGANSINCGGGGGGNAGVGGVGGNEWRGVAGGPMNLGGLGGYNFVYSSASDKIFLGGGGGAGNENDLNNSDAGNGGAIVLILGNKIIGRNNSIIADGQQGKDCNCIDGVGGGGSGGTVLVNAQTVYDLEVAVNGGRGANVTNTDVPHGAGGGGGGGTLLINKSALLSGITYTNNGGIAGRYRNPPIDTPWGAMPGSNGSMVANFTAYIDTTPTISNFATAIISDSTLDCYSLQLKAAITPATGISGISWSFGDGTYATTNPVIHTYSSGGTYTIILTVTNTAGCIDTFQHVVIVSGGTSVKASGDTVVCNGTSAHLYASGSISYSWSPSGTLNDSTIANPIALTGTTTVYTVIGTDSIGCKSKDSIRLNVYPLPIVKAVADKNVKCGDHAMQLTATGATSYTWSPGSYFNDSTISNPVIAFSETPVTVFVKGITDKGCSGYDSLLIPGFKKTSMGIPSAFSPNGDGANDILYVRGSNIRSLDFLVFNRWGQKIFETTDINQGWDGTFNGTPQPVESYACVVIVTNSNGCTIEKKGSVTLLR